MSQLEPAAAELAQEVAKLAEERQRLVGKPVAPDVMLSPMLFSIAISLKRLADAIDGTSLGININDTILNPQTVQNRDVRNNY